MKNASERWGGRGQNSNSGRMGGIVVNLVVKGIGLIWGVGHEQCMKETN